MCTNDLIRLYVLGSVTIIIAAWLMVYANQIPETQLPTKWVGARPGSCVTTPDLLNRFCCALPPFFTREVSRKCGGSVKVESRITYNVSTMKRFYYHCRHWFCVLDQYALINRDGTVNEEKFFSHLDLWVTLNPAFTDVMIEAKLNCKMTFRFFFPLKVCDFPKLSMCLRTYMTIKCPVTYPTAECEEQKEYYKRCAQYHL